MRKLFTIALLPSLLAAGVLPASAQGIGVNLGGIGVSVGGSGVGVSVGGTGVSVGTSGVSVGGTGSASTGATATDSPVELSQQAAIDAVNSHRAVSLDAILAKARAIAGGQVIDARLISYRSFLLYDLKVLAPTGDVSELYFYARSGEQVQSKQ